MKPYLKSLIRFIPSFIPGLAAFDCNTRYDVSQLGTGATPTSAKLKVTPPASIYFIIFLEQQQYELGLCGQRVLGL